MRDREEDSTRHAENLVRVSLRDDKIDRVALASKERKRAEIKKKEEKTSLHFHAMSRRDVRRRNIIRYEYLMSRDATS